LTALLAPARLPRSASAGLHLRWIRRRGLTPAAFWGEFSTSEVDFSTRNDQPDWISPGVTCDRRVLGAGISLGAEITAGDDFWR
jgi:hypothetical protein